MTTGFTQVPLAIYDYAEEVGGYGIAVYTALLSYSHGKGWCTPAIDSLAARAGFSRNTVKRALKALQDAGLVEVERRNTPDGRTSNRYRLMLTVAPVKAERPARRAVEPTAKPEPKPAIPARRVLPDLGTAGKVKNKPSADGLPF